MLYVNFYNYQTASLLLKSCLSEAIFSQFWCWCRYAWLDIKGKILW